MIKYNVFMVLISALLSVSGIANAIEVYNRDGNKLDVYGKIISSRHFDYNYNNFRDSGDYTHTYIGLKGETYITNQLIGFTQFTYDFQGNDYENNVPSQNNYSAFAGLKFGNAGSLDYGHRNTSIVHDLMDQKATLPAFGGNSGYRDNFIVGRSAGVVTYHNTNFFGLVNGLNFTVEYQGQSNLGNLRRVNSDSGWGASASYTHPAGLGVFGSYAFADKNGVPKNIYYYVAKGASKNGKPIEWATGIKYDVDNIYLAAIYSESYNTTYNINSYMNINNAVITGFADRSRLIELVAQYQFDFGLRPSFSYVQSKGKDTESVDSVDLIKYFEFGATYYLNKNMSTYVDYVFNQVDDDNILGIRSSDSASMGLVYEF